MSQVDAMPSVRPLRRQEYDHLVALGLFEGEPIELLRGELIVLSPQGSAHAWVVSRLTKWFVQQLGDRAEVRAQCPLALSDTDEPEPDVAVVPPGDYRHVHPTEAWLVVEVATTSLRYDLGPKAEVYALAGIPCFWVVDTRGEVQVHEAPVAGRYTRVFTFGRGQVFEILGLFLPTDDILP